MDTQPKGGGESRAHPLADTDPSRPPVILITPDFLPNDKAETEHEYAVRTNYAEAISEAGGLALILPYHSEQIADALALCDGILVTGTQPGAEVPARRSTFERTLVHEALAAGKPLLGICHGMQLIGEYLGGSFAKDLPDLAGETTAHLPHVVPDRLAHEIVLTPGSLLATWQGGTTARVNSLHRHALTGTGRFDVLAIAPDGVTEAFEAPGDTFCLGVQWHPEYGLTALDRQIFKGFVAKCAERRSGPQRPSRNSLIEARLSELGLALPEASTPPGAFVGAIRTGNVVSVSGQVPLRDGKVVCTGQVGGAVSIDEARDSARWALLNGLVQLEKIAGGLDRVTGFVRLAGYVSAAPDFTRHGQVVDAASELLRDLFPDRWMHARVAVGVSSLPRGVPVEIELSATIAGGC
ncbi:MAG TPA: Atu1372/SO_1960 family protein [Pararhizobium sp.]|uniref:Atu1372/SO_1960 family protein n=1 Tax=Pararhizobium sp. TaxID=1977563 RepID=UPI002CE97331|nr:Atu1372/SO_1960 family protein [Pararhizobium sp.]HTO31004.1 Atu1372/SO_1960 family protein [Pararhizobium sp.]